MGDEPRALEVAESEAMAASAAIAAVVDLSGGPATGEQARAPESPRASAVRHLSAALEVTGRAKGGDA